MSKIRVLIVDDEEDIIEFTEMALTATGFSVITAEDGEQGLKLALSEKPDIILLDVMMPGLDGFSVCKQLKDNPETQHIPILMVSAKALNQDIKKGMQSGCNDYMIKPFEMNELVEKIKKLTESSTK